MARHSRAIRARQAAALIDAKPGTFGSIGKRCEVAFLYDRGCVPSYLFTINGMQSILLSRAPGCCSGNFRSSSTFKSIPLFHHKRPALARRKP